MVEPEESEHRTKVGAGLIAHAYGLAMFEIRQDRRLIGLDKLRKALANEAALRATGFPQRPFKLPRGAGEATQEMQEIAEEVLDRAIAAAQRDQGDG